MRVGVRSLYRRLISTTSGQSPPKSEARLYMSGRCVLSAVSTSRGRRARGITTQNRNKKKEVQSRGIPFITSALRCSFSMIKALDLNALATRSLVEIRAWDQRRGSSAREIGRQKQAGAVKARGAAVVRFADVGAKMCHDAVSGVRIKNDDTYYKGSARVGQGNTSTCSIQYSIESKNRYHTTHSLRV